ncbi:MAG: DUF2892 domain-containing protein [Acidimicrobiaceae bacterium]|nr:DUF2892 domain-containing protein [Acidimicrobiaceae bacterium]
MNIKQAIASLYKFHGTVSYALAGIFSLFGAALIAGVSKWLVLLSIIVGVNQLMVAAVGWCPISKVLDIVLRRTASETA